MCGLPKWNLYEGITSLNYVLEKDSQFFTRFFPFFLEYLLEKYCIKDMV